MELPRPAQRAGGHAWSESEFVGKLARLEDRYAAEADICATAETSACVRDFRREWRKFQ